MNYPPLSGTTYGVESLMESYELHDSGSSNSDHSSPASDESGSLVDAQGWPIFTIQPQVEEGGGKLDQSWMREGFSLPDEGFGGMDQGDRGAGGEEGGLSLTSDFWNTAPSSTVHSPVAVRLATTVDVVARGMEMQDGEEIKTELENREGAGLYYPLASEGLSMPVDLVAVNSGISPRLTGGILSPPGVMLEEQGIEEYRPRSSRAVEDGRGFVPPPEEVEEDEEEEDEKVPTARKVRKAPIVSTNLVAKDAIVASSIIPTLVVPSLPLDSDSLQMLVLGVPTIGAKSRVETQIKISVVLVRAVDGGEIVPDEIITGDGGIERVDGAKLERVGTWSHVKLPSFMALKKKKAKKPLKEPPLASTLFLEVALVGGSSPFEQIFICPGCRQREHKRAQRKKDARIRPSLEEVAALEGEEGEEEERKKVVVFNCPEYVEFGQGEVVLPTRITCYCRHHKERKGFAITFVFKDHEGRIVATGATPPIMITDDHKTNNTYRQSISHDAVDLPPPVKSKRGRSTKASPVQAKVALPPVERTKRVNSRSKAARGMVDTDEDDLVATASTSTSDSTRSSSIGRKFSNAKPYDTDARPRKRTSGVHKSPAFTMTPLPMSKVNSPVLRPALEHLSAVPSLPNGYDESSWGSSLGLAGMPPGDTTMRDSQSYSTGFSPEPSPAPSAVSHDWSIGTSPPPFSPPGITIPHTVESFIPFGQPQRNDSTASLSQLHHAQQSRQHMPIGLQGFSPYDTSLATNLASAQASWSFPAPRPLVTPPRISRLIPGEGPIHGGIEVTVLGENFVRDLICVFGDSPAMSTHYWSSNTLICILPPSANPGPVVVGIKGLPLTVDDGNGLQLFTYKDDSDRSLLELALQVVGLKMTGRLEDAKNVAMRIVGSSANTGMAPSTSRHASPTDNSGLMLSMAAATAAVLHPPANSRTSSRRSSIDLSASNTPLNFEAIVIRFLSLLDLDPSEIPGSTPLPLASGSPISHANKQRHTLLHLAAVLGFHRLSQFLIARGIDLESPDKNGFTALHFAALYGRVAIARQLLDAGAASYARNGAGKTAHEIARDRDDVDVEELFLRSRPAPVGVPRRASSGETYSRASSVPGTPASGYARSVSSDWDDETHASEEDDSQFDESDEETDDEDIERGLSRNASFVSLHHLLEMEAAVAVSNARSVESDAEEEEELLATRSRSRPKMSWLTRPTVIFPAAKQEKDSTGVATTAVWATPPIAPGAWEKMALQFPLIPELIAFPTLPAFPTAWLGGKKESTSTVQREEKGKDWKSLRPWWATKTPRTSSPPPPMYSPTDALQPAVVVASTSAPPAVLAPAPPPTTGPAPLKAQVKAKIQRRVGYAPEDISDSVVQSYLHHERKMKNLKHDKMLYIFWLPILLLVAAWVVYSSFGLYVRPSLDTLVDSLLPFARTV